MANVDKDWVKQQMAKAISAEQSVVKSEKEHREKIKDPEIAGLYDHVIEQDEKHLDELQQIAGKYGRESGGVMEGAGGILGGLKSALESVGTSDPFQTVGTDLMMKSNALNYDLAWSKIFRNIGDTPSARALEQAAKEDEEHQELMRQALVEVGKREVHGEKIEED